MQSGISGWGRFCPSRTNRCHSHICLFTGPALRFLTWEGTPCHQKTSRHLTFTQSFTTHTNTPWLDLLQSTGTVHWAAGCKGQGCFSPWSWVQIQSSGPCWKTTWCFAPCALDSPWLVRMPGQCQLGAVEVIMHQTPVSAFLTSNSSWTASWVQTLITAGGLGLLSALDNITHSIPWQWVQWGLLHDWCSEGKIKSLPLIPPTGWVRAKNPQPCGLGEPLKVMLTPQNLLVSTTQVFWTQGECDDQHSQVEWSPVFEPDQRGRTRAN